MLRMKLKMRDDGVDDDENSKPGRKRLRSNVETLNFFTYIFMVCPQLEVCLLKHERAKGNFISIFSNHDSLFRCFYIVLNAVYASVALNFCELAASHA
jgi:hypothetical protein